MPFVDMGTRIEVGDAFVANIGQCALYDFTAVGDVVNSASRRRGEMVIFQPVADGLPGPPGTRVELQLKRKREPQIVYRLAV